MAVSLLLAVGFGWALQRSPARTRAAEIRFRLPLRDDTAHVYLGGANGRAGDAGAADATWGWPRSTDLAISPDGSMLVYAAWRPGPGRGELRSALYRRRVDREDAEAIPGTEGATTPFFSPDGHWIGFFQGSSLRRVAVTGGQPETIIPDAHLPARGPMGASWGDEGSVVYGGAGGLYRVAGGAGEATRLVEVDTAAPGFRRIAQPQILPGSRALLFHRYRTADPKRAEIVALDLATNSQTAVLRDAMDPHYVDTGQLLFMRRGALWAVDFDLERLEAEGQPRLVLEDVMQAVGVPNYQWETGAAQVAVSRSGHLAYARGGVFPNEPAMPMRVDLDGEERPIDLDSLRYGAIRVSKGGDRLAMEVLSGLASSIHVYDLVRGTTDILRTGGFADAYPIWSPDGKFIAFSSDRTGTSNLYRMAADGSGEPERLAPSDESQFPSSWSSDGVLAYVQGGDIWVLPPDGDPKPFFTSEEQEGWPDFSPDGRWIAYAAGQPAAGTVGVFVRPYPGPGRAVRVASRGEGPSWSRDGSRIYYLDGTGDHLRMMAANVTSRDPFKVGPARVLIDPWAYDWSGPVRSYDILTDTSFIAVIATGAQAASDEASSLGLWWQIWRYRVGELHVILNFGEGLSQGGGK
jgi:Tol biopolymer transport system component